MPRCGWCRGRALVPRAGYWLTIVFGTYAVGFLAHDVLARFVGRAGSLPAMGLSSLAGALAVTLCVLAINAVILGVWPDGWDGWDDGSEVATIFAIAVTATATINVVSGHVPHGSTPASTSTNGADPIPPALLHRLPLDKRGPLVALSVEDHDVRIRTLKGEDLILMRLSDAVREAVPTPGLQVHRSHWVALAHVRAARRDGDRAILSMTHGGDIPVSRANMPAIRKAGLLPR